MNYISKIASYIFIYNAVLQNRLYVLQNANDQVRFFKQIVIKMV